MRAEHRFNAIVLAADRGPGDPVARRGGRPGQVPDAHCREPDGRPRRARPRAKRLRQDHSALRSDGRNPARIAGAAPAGVGRPRPLDGPGATPSTSAALALAALPDDEPVLLTTGDHALLDPVMVRHFLDQASASGGRRRRRAGAARARAEGLPAHASDRAEVQRRALLRLQSLRVSLAARPRDGARSGNRWKPSARSPSGSSVSSAGGRCSSTRSAC